MGNDDGGGESRSPFLEIPPAAWVGGNGLAFAVRDKYPVSPGHTLVIPEKDNYLVDQHGPTTIRPPLWKPTSALALPFTMRPQTPSGRRLPTP